MVTWSCYWWWHVSRSCTRFSWKKREFERSRGSRWRNADDRDSLGHCMRFFLFLFFVFFETRKLLFIILLVRTSDASRIPKVNENRLICRKKVVIGKSVTESSSGGRYISTVSVSPPRFWLIEDTYLVFASEREN